MLSNISFRKRCDRGASRASFFSVAGATPSSTSAGLFGADDAIATNSASPIFVIPADVYFRRNTTIIKRREKIEKQTFEIWPLYHQRQAA
jgi:hypothetical protein